MAKQREIRDPIHGFIQRSELEEKIIDTKVFQRLRGIKQLAMANLVYPGAMHTRFGHSIGVMHVAGIMAKKLLPGDEDTIRTIRLSALLHDIGHGPFSHVSEDIVDKYYYKSKIKPKSKEKIHELITAEIIRKDSEIKKHISNTESDKIIGLLSGTRGESIEKSIISGPLDADKQDYLLRDSYFCGVKYGVFDPDRLVSTLSLYDDQQDTILAASQDGVYAIEQFVLAKYHMATQVYRHKIRLVTDAMIIRALELGIEVDKIEWLNNLYAFDGTEEYINNYLQWDDARLINALLYGADQATFAADIFRRLKNRELFKTVFRKSLREIESAEVRDFLANIKKENGFCKIVEEQIADYLSSQMSCKIEAKHVIVSTFSIKSVREQSRNDAGSIIILNNSGTPRYFEDESTLFRSIDERENDRCIEAYAPFKYIDDVDKRKKKACFNEDIQNILEASAKTFLSERRDKK